MVSTIIIIVLILEPVNTNFRIFLDEGVHMGYNGFDFYNRLSDLCSKNGTTISAFLISTGRSQSAGTYMKKRKTPDSELVALASERFGVSSGWLLGIEEDEGSEGSNSIELNNVELDLIKRLRQADATTYRNVLKMAFSVLPVEVMSDVSSSSNDGISHRTEGDAETSGVRTFRKRVEGEAAAGVPITAVPEEDSFVSVPEKYLDERYFIVRARGDSMESTIPNGACCVFQRDVPPTDGAISLVQIEGATDQPDDTIKRVYLHGRQIELRSDNPAFAPMFYPAQSVQIAGVLVAVLEINPSA